MYLIKLGYYSINFQKYKQKYKASIYNKVDGTTQKTKLCNFEIKHNFVYLNGKRVKKKHIKIRHSVYHKVKKP